MSLGEFYHDFFWIVWALWMIVWLALANEVKVTVRRQATLPRLLNLALLLCAAALLGAPYMPVAWLMARILRSWQWKFWAAVGAALTLLGMLFMVWARIYLGRNWSGVAAIKADHELVTGGPYRWVRHPIYSGLALALVGTAIAMASRGEHSRWRWRSSQSRIGCSSRSASCASNSAPSTMRTPGGCGRSYRVSSDQGAREADPKGLIRLLPAQ